MGGNCSSSCSFQVKLGLRLSVIGINSLLTCVFDYRYRYYSLAQLRLERLTIKRIKQIVTHHIESGRTQSVQEACACQLWEMLCDSDWMSPHCRWYLHQQRWVFLKHIKNYGAHPQPHKCMFLCATGFQVA